MKGPDKDATAQPPDVTAPTMADVSPPPVVDERPVLTIEPPHVSGMRHVMRALDALRSGTRTSLHLHPDEHAALTEKMATDPPKHEAIREIISRLLKGEEVNPPAPGAIPEDVQTA